MRMQCAAVILLGLMACGDDGGAATPIDAGPDAACDQQSDPTCCGAIGHDCQGGACTAGVCQPVVLAEPITAADLAITDATLYFVEPVAGTVVRLGTDGSGRAVVATTPDLPIAVAASTDAVAWATTGLQARDGAIMRLATGATTPTTIATMEHAPCDLVLDATGAVWTNYGSGAVPVMPGELRAAPATGTPATIVPSLVHACGLAATGSAIYYATFGTNPTDPIDGAIATVARGGGTSLTLAANRRGARYLALTGSHVYWTEQGTTSATFQDGRVMRMSRSGGFPEVLADDVRPRGVFADGDAVYWLAGGAVRRLALADRAMTTVATFPGRTLTVLVGDADALYFLVEPNPTTGAAGQLIKVAR